ncbi:hypothetical protein BC628DRAFT_1395820 [Trametes gibbosa]|nr:hypothetical protein BC628DRAFT_1395820 [Trametes gibbosa]
MQIKTFFTLASVAIIASARPAAEFPENVTLTTAVTTDTFTASKLLQSFMKVDPWVTTITTNTVWIVTQTVTQAVSSATATTSA